MVKGVGRYEALKIVIFATVMAIVYGIIHDQFTAHLSVEYFTIAHPPVFPTEVPFLLALGWGVIASWWVGLLLGIALATAARLGATQKRSLAELRRPILLLMLASGLAAALAGATGAALVATGVLPVPGGWEDVIPPEKHVSFSAAAWAHEASYAVGGLGGMIVIFHTVRQRLRDQRRLRGIVPDERPQ